MTSKQQSAGGTLTFDEASHVYHFDGERVPNVTTILKPLTSYDMIPADKLEVARQKGVAVHKMVELDALGQLDEIPDWMKPAYIEWLKFKKQTGFILIASEQKVFHRAFRYAGTLDLLCELPLTKFKGVGIVDVKRSFFAGAVIGLQTAAYASAVSNSTTHKKLWRAALRLNENSAFRVEAYDDPNDHNVFIAALTMHNWQRSHK